MPLADDMLGLAKQYGILVATVLAMVGVFALVKRMKNASPGDVQTDFTLNDLRKLRDSGQMTEVEYNAAKTKVVERAKEKMKGPAGKRGKGAELGEAETPPPSETRP